MSNQTNKSTAVCTVIALLCVGLSPFMAQHLRVWYRFQENTMNSATATSDLFHAEEPSHGFYSTDPEGLGAAEYGVGLNQHNAHVTLPDELFRSLGNKEFTFCFQFFTSSISLMGRGTKVPLFYMRTADVRRSMSIAHLSNKTVGLFFGNIHFISTEANSAPFDQWNTLCLSRIHGVYFQLNVNGQSLFSRFKNNFDVPGILPGGTMIGSLAGQDQQQFVGYITNARFYDLAWQNLCMPEALHAVTTFREEHSLFLHHSLQSYDIQDWSVNNFDGVELGLDITKKKLDGWCAKTLFFTGHDNSYFRMNADALAGLGTFTVAFWLYIDNMNRSQTVLSFITTEDKIQMMVYVTASKLWITMNGQNIPYPVDMVKEKVFQHITFTVFGSDFVYYLNGAQVGNATLNCAVPLAAGLLNSFVMGQRLSSTFGEFEPDQAFIGSVTQFRMHQEALDSSQVNSLYNIACHPSEKHNTDTAVPFRYKHTLDVYWAKWRYDDVNHINFTVSAYATHNADSRLAAMQKCFSTRYGVDGGKLDLVIQKGLHSHQRGNTIYDVRLSSADYEVYKAILDQEYDGNYNGLCHAEITDIVIKSRMYSIYISRITNWYVYAIFFLAIIISCLLIVLIKQRFKKKSAKTIDITVQNALSSPLVEEA